MHNELENELEELKTLLLNEEKWDDMPDSDFSINVDRSGKFKFQIRTKEQCHFKGHFHVIAADKSGSYIIDPVSKRDGNFTGEDNKKIISWANKNKIKLVNVWNKYHPNKKIGGKK